MKKTFTEIADYGDRKYFIRDFNYVFINDDGEEEKEIPLVLVAQIMDYYDAAGEDRFEKEPYGITIDILPTMEYIDKKHIKAAAKGVPAEDVTYVDIVGYMGGIPIISELLNKSFEEMEDAEKYLLSKELNNHLNALSAMIGFYLDGAINRIGDTRWSRLEAIVDSNKKW